MAKTLLVAGSIVKSKKGEVQIMVTSSKTLIRTKQGDTERLRTEPRNSRRVKVSPLMVALGFHYNLTK